MATAVTTVEKFDTPAQDPLKLGSHTLASRLIVGTGKYASYEQMGVALERSGTDCITVAIRRERLINAEGNNLLDAIDTARYTLLPNIFFECPFTNCRKARFKVG